MFMLLKIYFTKLKKRFIKKRDDLSKKEYLLKKDAISSNDAILRKNFEKNMQRLFDKYKNI